MNERMHLECILSKQHFNVGEDVILIKVDGIVDNHALPRKIGDIGMVTECGCMVADRAWHEMIQVEWEDVAGRYWYYKKRFKRYEC